MAWCTPSSIGTEQCSCRCAWECPWWCLFFKSGKSWGKSRIESNKINVGGGQSGQQNYGLNLNSGGRVDTQVGRQDKDKGGVRLGQEENESGTGAGLKMMCNKCKDTRHATKDCKLSHCVMCGEKNHITDECSWLRQMKLVPKFVGYAARGLGVLLVQNFKDVLYIENRNPMAIVKIDPYQ